MSTPQHDPHHYDVLIIGAGLSGIGTACHMARERPDKHLAILERRERIGGTWDLFRYPGIRSDSDMCSFSYRFRPWTSRQVLAEGASICEYIRETADAFGVMDKVHYGLKVIAADRSSEERHWTVTAVHEASGERREYRCNFLIGCTGYYDHDAGFRPAFPGEEDFKGAMIHPQQWPEGLDYRGKKVVVIGSGATAVTMVPAMAGIAGHVTMLQRSPSYIFSIPSQDRLSALLARILPARWAYGMARRRNIWLQRAAYLACRRWPKMMRRFLLSHVRKRVGPDFDMRHFTPSYMPWDERLCVVPNADLFNVLRDGKASIETGRIERFTENGIRLTSGKELEADIVVTATGLKLQMLGGMALSVDGQSRPLSGQMTYKGVLIERVPNLAWVFGYINVSWTLKVEIAARYLCRLFEHMDAQGLDTVVPVDRDGNALDDGILDALRSGYVQRDRHRLPRQGRAYPWRVLMHYGRDRKMLLKDPVQDARLHFTAAGRVPQERARAELASASLAGSKA